MPDLVASKHDYPFDLNSTPASITYIFQDSRAHTLITAHEYVKDNMPASTNPDVDDQEVTGCPEESLSTRRPVRSTRNHGPVYDKRIHPGLDPHIRPAHYERLTGEEMSTTPGRRYSTSSESDAQTSGSSSSSIKHSTLRSLSDDDEESEEDQPISRRPDPKATRRSTRTSTATPPLYDMRKHPQDKEIRAAMHSPMKRKHAETPPESGSGITTTFKKTPSTPSLLTKRSRRIRDSTSTLDDSAVIVTYSKRADTGHAIPITSSPGHTESEQEDDNDIDEQRGQTPDHDRVVHRNTRVTKSTRPSTIDDQPNLEDNQADKEDTSARDDLEAAGEIVEDIDLGPVAAYNASKPSIDIDAEYPADAQNGNGKSETHQSSNSKHDPAQSQLNHNRPMGAKTSFQDQPLAPPLNLDEEDFRPVVVNSTPGLLSQANVGDRGGFWAAIAASGLTIEQMQAEIDRNASQRPPTSTVDGLAAAPGAHHDSTTPQSSNQSNFTALSSSAPPIASQHQGRSQSRPPSQSQTRAKSHKHSTKGKSCSQQSQGSQTRMMGRRLGLNIRPDFGGDEHEISSSSGGSSSHGILPRHASSNGYQQANQGRGRSLQGAQTPEPRPNTMSGDDSASTLSVDETDDMDGLSAIQTK